MHDFPTYFRGSTPVGGTPKSMELHLGASPLFVRTHGKRVKAVGGRYTHVRGDRTTRYVTLPFKATEVIESCIREYGSSKVTVIMRGTKGSVPSWVTVQKVSRDLPRPWARVANAYGDALGHMVDRGLATVVAPPPSEDAIQLAADKERGENIAADLTECGVEASGGPYGVMLTLDAAEKLARVLKADQATFVFLRAWCRAMDPNPREPAAGNAAMKRLFAQAVLSQLDQGEKKRK